MESEVAVLEQRLTVGAVAQQLGRGTYTTTPEVDKLKVLLAEEAVEEQQQVGVEVGRTPLAEGRQLAVGPGLLL